MTPEQDRELCELAPNLYRNRTSSPHTTCMCWGFVVGAGWFDLLKECSIRLEMEILKLPKEERAQYTAAQVKCKFGGLRLYMDRQTDDMTAIINLAEQRAWKTCEKCGNPGEIITGGWWKVRCKEHIDD